MVMVVMVIAVYRLLAERERRTTLLLTYLYAPAGTVVARGQDSAEPQAGIWVGGEHSPVPAPPVMPQRAFRPAGRVRLAGRGRR